MDLSFSKAEPLLRSFRRLTHGLEQISCTSTFSGWLMATATARAHVSAGTARAYDVRSRAAMPAHVDAMVQR
jgi:hypothetical protein